jgi:protein-tyrosine-phosphatase
MAATLLNKYGHGRFQAQSSGTRQGHITEYAVEVMQEAGLDILNQPLNEVSNLVRQNSSFEYIIILCSEKELEGCPILSPKVAGLHWILDDPQNFEGTDEEITASFRRLRDLIKRVVKRFVTEVEKAGVDADLNFESAIR